MDISKNIEYKQYFLNLMQGYELTLSFKTF